jgi:hypothetical protein
MATDFGQRVEDTQLDPQAAAVQQQQVVDISEQGNAPVAIDDPALFADDALDTRPDIFVKPARENIQAQLARDEDRHTNNKMNKAQADGMITGQPSLVESEYGVTTVDDELIQFMLDTYNDEFDPPKTLIEELRTLPDDQKNARLQKELLRRSAHEINARQQLLIFASYNGFGNMPQAFIDTYRRTLTPQQLQGLGKQLKQRQAEQFQQAVDELGADFYVGDTAEATVKAVTSDFTPFWAAIARIGVTNVVVEATNVSKKGWRAYLPGEQRQRGREALSRMPVAAQIEVVQDVHNAFRKMADGKYGEFMNEYLIMEVISGTFTPELINENDPKQTADRIMGNFDTLIEMIYGLGLIARVSGRTIKSGFRHTDINKAILAAKAAGNNKLVAELTDSMKDTARRYEMTPEQAAAVDYPKPASMVGEREVLTDSTLEVLERSKVIGSRIMLQANEGTADALRVADKDNAVREFQVQLEESTGFKRHPKMDVIEEIEDGAGVRVTAVVGPDTNGGWKSLSDMVDDVAEVDPQLDKLRLLRRGDKGTLEDMNITPEEFARLLVTREAPSRLLKADLDDALHNVDGDDFYVQITQDRFWSPTDKIGFNAESILTTWSPVVIPPNRIFGDHIYDSFARAALKDANIRTDFNQIYEPYYKLSKKEKIQVSSYMEWAEDFARKEERAPMIKDFRDIHPRMTERELNAIVALRAGLDIQWSLFNRRLFRDMNARGLISIRPRNGIGARYHGVKIKPGRYGGDSKTGTGAYDPKV